MKIYEEISLTNFEFWSGATETVKHLTEEQLEQLEQTLEEIYPDGMSATQVNDIFWFETDWMAECLGFDDWESFLEEEEVVAAT